MMIMMMMVYTETERFTLSCSSSTKKLAAMQKSSTYDADKPEIK